MKIDLLKALKMQQDSQKIDILVSKFKFPSICCMESENEASCQATALNL